MRQRHSVEISSSFLLAQYSSDLAVALEESCAASAERPESSGNLPSSSSAASAIPSSSSSSSGVTAGATAAGTTLTPTLSLLADVWEKLSEHCIELIQSEPPSVVVPPEEVVKSKPVIPLEIINYLA